MSSEKYLTPITPEQVKLEIKDPVDPQALEQAKAIIAELRSSSADDGNTIASSILPSNLIAVGQRLKDIPKESNKYIVSKEECKTAYDNLDETERKALNNIHARVKAFADVQRKSVTDTEIDIPGGKAGHTVSPCRGKVYTNLLLSYNTNDTEIQGDLTF
jgi:histidinol dehydrogenase